MTDALKHRGPDSGGTYVDGCLGLGHRRLAILDPSPAGHQPMLSEDGRFAISYNGEVYNFQELRTELEGCGHVFRSRTDTEVVLRAFIEWGPECSQRFNGMFAFAIWDQLEQRLFVARDRYGIKPLYYTIKGPVVLFASEQKALLSHPELGREIDLEALLEYFTFQNIFTDRTLLKGIRLFPPGSWAFISKGDTGSNLDHRRFWDFDFQEPDDPLRDEEYVEQLDRLFCQAVQRQLVSDVDLGSYLSGGMDSGSITAIAATRLPYIKTFTCGFDLHSVSGLELAFDEREAAEHMSYLFKTEHYEMVLKAGDMERVLSDIAWHLEEPRVGQSYPNYYVAQLAGKFVKVVLAGTGGDELFGGYPWRYYRAVVNHDFEDYVDKYYLYWQRLIPNRVIHEVFRPVKRQVEHVWTRSIFRDVFASHASELTRPEDYINHSLYFEAKTFLHGLLIVEDKLSMAHGLENRVPFLDNDLVDFAMRVPVRLKLAKLGEVVRLNENEPGRKSARYFRKTSDGKLLLRQAMERYVPTRVLEAVKQGFSAPDATWFKGDSIDYVRRSLFARSARIYDYFDYKAVTALVTEHLEGKKNRRLLLWSLLNFENWLSRFLDSGGE
jgi:asparagine synthase (glutamine-hydrolysing)